VVVKSEGVIRVLEIGLFDDQKSLFSVFQGSLYAGLTAGKFMGKKYYQ